MKINLSLNIDMPKTVNSDLKHKQLIDKIRDFMVCCESDINSDYHYNYLTNVYLLLKQKKKLTPESREIFDLLNDYFNKTNGYASDENHIDLEGSEFWKHSEK